MKTIDFSYFIERYNSGEMNEDEKQWFLKEIESNKPLRDEVLLRRETDRILGERATFNLRNKLADIELKRSAVVSRKKSGKVIAIRFAAAISIFILLGSLVLISRRNLSGEEIMEKFHKPYEGVSPSRSVENKLAADYKTALEYYNIKDYRNAAYYFARVLQMNPEDMESTMMLGVSNFEEKNYPDAEKTFTKVVDNNDNLFIEDAQWYLALCYIQTNDKNRAAEQLAIISKSESIYRRDARRILRGIR